MVEFLPRWAGGYGAFFLTFARIPTSGCPLATIPRLVSHIYRIIMSDEENILFQQKT